MFALVLSEDRISFQARRKEIIEGLSRLPGKPTRISDIMIILFVITTIFLPEQVDNILKKDAEIVKMAEDMRNARSVLVLGRGYNLATCLEGALVGSKPFLPHA